MISLVRFAPERKKPNENRNTITVRDKDIYEIKQIIAVFNPIIFCEDANWTFTYFCNKQAPKHTEFSISISLINSFYHPKIRLANCSHRKWFGFHNHPFPFLSHLSRKINLFLKLCLNSFLSDSVPFINISSPIWYRERRKGFIIFKYVCLQRMLYF